MSDDTRTVWTQTGKSSEPLLVGRRLSLDWLAGSEDVVSLRFTGATRQALATVVEAARQARNFLPIVSLRILLASRLEGLITLERDLGVAPQRSETVAAELRAPYDREPNELASVVEAVMREWVQESLEPWAGRHESLFRPVATLKDVLCPDDCQFTQERRPLVASGRVDYPLIARVLGDLLAGEELFDRAGACELVLSPEFRSNRIELMSPPMQVGRHDVFSMVARLAVVTIPYSSDLFLSVSAVKRNWARRLPSNAPSVPGRATAYVMTPGRPAMPVPAERGDDGWAFGDGYLSLLRESDGQLPGTLAAAVERRTIGGEDWWFAGIPELPVLFPSWRLAPRSVLEVDEVDLLTRVSGLLKPCIDPNGIDYRTVRVPRVPRRGEAGTLGPGDLEDEDEDSDNSDRVAKVERIRAQNCAALEAAYPAQQPVLWVLSDYSEESGIVEQVAQKLFGNAIELRREPLPVGTHGLKAELDARDEGPRARFEARLSRWDAAVKRIRAESGSRPTFVVVCAPDTIGKKPEDHVNMYAGIHALAGAGANLHYLLPIASGGDEQAARDSFIYRAQSALLDVLLAHAGIVLDTASAVSAQLPPGAIPGAIYGIQAVRSRPRPRSGERGANFLLYTRLVVAKGLTEAKIGYRGMRGNLITEWMPLPQALSWIGSQRSLTDGDANWLAANFADLTRDVLTSIAEDDPHAIVLVDWGTVRGLWKGISDADLTPGASPKLAGADLSRLAHMSFVRLRRGADTIALRRAVRATYALSREGAGREATGESEDGTYYTTGKNIVELSPTSERTRRHGHFVASMGYAQTVQALRGMSCYRTMPRFRKPKGGGDDPDYVRELLTPANKDIALPAPLDITVMTCPSGTTPEELARLILELRRGFAHYDDWTALPAPLFFRRKVDDYVVRFAEDAEPIAVSDESPVGQDLSEPTSLTGLAASDLAPVTNEVAAIGQAPEAEEPQVLAVDTSENEGERPVVEASAKSAEYEVVPSDDALVLAARAAEYPPFEPPDSFQVRRLYRGMIQERLRVRVDLPYWISPATCLEANRTMLKRGRRRAWDRGHEYGYIPAGKGCPPGEELLLWLARKLVIPQAAFALRAISREFGGIWFEPLRQIIEEDYNPSVDDDSRVDPHSFDDSAMARMARWAEQHGHDRLAAWLVFQAAQFPISRWVGSVVGQLSRPIGPLTEEALRYFLQCAEAVAQARDRGTGANFDPIIKSRPHIAVADPTIVASSAATPFRRAPIIAFDSLLPAPSIAHVVIPPIQQPEANRVNASSAPGTAPVPTIATESLATSEDPIMAAKAELIDVFARIQSLAPGDPHFDELVADIERNLTFLRACHQVALEEQMVQAQTEKLRNNWRASAERVAADLTPHLGDLGLSGIEVRNDVTDNSLPAALDEQIKLQNLLADFVAHQANRHSYHALPLLEQRKRKCEYDAAFNGLMAALADIAETLSNSLNYNVVPVPPENPPPSEDTPSPELGDPAPEPAVPAETDTKALAASASVLPIEPPAVPVPAHAGPVVDDPAVPAVLPPQTAVIPHADDSEDTPHMGIEAVLTCAGTAVQLVSKRLYTLAGIHCDALWRLLGDSPEKTAKSHGQLLDAAINTLEAADCRDAFGEPLTVEFTELLEDLPSTPDCRPFFVGLGVFAASLPAMLLLSDVQTRWLPVAALAARFKDNAPLSHLVAVVARMHEAGLFPTRDMFPQSHANEALACEREIERMEAMALTWRDSGELYSGYSHRGFIKMHMLMFGPKHPIGQCVEAIGRGNAQRVAALYHEHKRRFDRSAATVAETFRAIGELNQPDGAFRNATIDNIRRTQEFIERYLALAVGSNVAKATIPAPVAAFLRECHDSLSGSVEALTQLQPANALESFYVAAARRCGEAVLRLYRGEAPPPCLTNEQQRLLLQLPLDLGLAPVLDHSENQPALCTPARVFEETARLADDLPVMTQLDASVELSDALSDALAGHRAAKRFLPAFRLDKLLGGKETLALTKEYEGERVELEALAQELRQRVTHALALNTLGNVQASQMLRTVDDILLQLRPEARLGRPDLASGRYCDFPQARMALRHQLIAPLEKSLAERVDQITNELDEYVANHPETRPGDSQRIRTLLASGKVSEILTACELHNILKEHGSLPPQTEATRDIAEEYSDYLRQVRADAHGHQRPLDELALRLAQGPDTADPPWLAPLDAGSRRDALDFIEAWRKLFVRHAAPDAADVERFFSGLGILPPALITDRTGQRRVQLQFDERAFSAAAHSAGQLFLPPALGSQARHLGGYLLFGNPKPEDLRQNIQQLQAKNIPGVVLARMRLSMAERSSLSGDAQALVIDDDLVAFAALQLQNRFAALMRVALLTFQTNPYKDWGRDPVPPEMFFGRQRELDRLRGVSGLAVLYGGRRLGKTSLLRQIELDAEQKPGVRAVAISLLAADKSPEGYLDSCWDSLYSRLLAVGLAEPTGRRPNRWRDISSLVEKDLRSRKDIRELYMLIDEADEVMACELDARPGAVTFVKSLQNMATNLAESCRVHFIIAGLHNMTRMTTAQNSPFGQAQSIRLEPFNSPDDMQRGIRLVTQPLAGLGYLFEKGDLPMRILSVCNFYPAFIQIYCQHLVEHMQNMRGSENPPTWIRASDLDAVERNEQLVHDLREKFRLNLDLDKRYKAIALILADDYYSGQERQTGERGLTTETIRDMCASLAGSHFNGTGQGAYDALLEEMVTLNLLDRNGNRWELRNPGVAMMLGERETILSQLSELSLMRPEASRSHGERRIEMSHAGNDQRRVLFPMPVSWVRRNLAGGGTVASGAPDSDLVVIAGNAVSGMGDLTSLDPGEYMLQEGVFRIISGSGPQAVQTFLTNAKSSKDKRPHLATLRAHAWQPGQIADLIGYAQKLSARGHRLVLLAPPEQAWLLARAVAEGKVPNINTGWRVDPIAPWNEDAVFFRLQENTAVADSKEALAAILEATCGFGKEVLSLCQPSLSRADALGAPEHARVTLAPSLPALFSRIGLPPACDDGWRHRAADFLAIIPDTERNTPAVAEALGDCGLDDGDRLFLYWMGLLQEGIGNTWRVPRLIASVLA